MAYELAKAYVQIIPTTEGFKDNLDKALNGSGDAGTSAGSAVGGKFSEGFKSAMSGLGSVVSSAVSGLRDIGMAAAQNVSEVAAVGDNIDKMSQKIGISSDAYQEWSFVMEHCGTSVDNLQMGMKTLSTQIIGARDDMESITDASEWAQTSFGQLGISMEEVSNLSNEELLAKTIEGLQGMEEGAERTALATQLLGRAGNDLGPLLNTSAEEVASMKEQVRALGGVMSEDAVKASAAFEDNMTDLKSAFSGIKNGIVSEFLPGINEAMGGITQFLGGDKEGGMAAMKEGIRQLIADLKTKGPEMLQAGMDLIKSLLEGLIEMLPEIAEGVFDLITGLCDFLIDNAPRLIEMGIELIVKLAEGLGEALPKLIPKITEAIVLICKKLTEPESINKLIHAALQIILGLVKGITQALPELVKAAPEIIMNIIVGIVSALPEILAAGGEIIASLWDGIANCLGWLGEMLEDVWDAIVGFFADAGSWLLEAGGNIIKGLWDGIASLGGWLYEKIMKFLDTILGWIPGVSFDVQSNVVAAAAVTDGRTADTYTPASQKKNDGKNSDTVIALDGQEIGRTMAMNLSEQLYWAE